jgi:starch phosphorylase
MTVLAMRYSGKQNGVSKLHGEVSRKMWHWLWPDKKVEETPISHVTNGIHTESWLAPELKALLDDAMGPQWIDNIDEPTQWEAVEQIPDDVLWQLRYTLRAKMLDFVRRRTRERLQRIGADQSQVDGTFNLLNNNALTIGFARRFATYKRATLMFTDVERLKRIIHTNGRPIQFIFSGKAHPRDEPGKEFIREVYQRSFEAGLAGHLIFVEDYDMNVARHLIQGVDVWLNTPRRPHEASGTSGQKSALHGGLNLSISDGWWPEGYNGKNGWMIGHGEEADDHRDAHYVYELLEQQVVPTFYTRNKQGTPEQWVAMMRNSIKTLGPQFSMSRMIKDYVNQLYVPLLKNK